MLMIEQILTGLLWSQSIKKASIFAGFFASYTWLLTSSCLVSRIIKKANKDKIDAAVR